MSVDNGEVVVVVLLADKAAGILAECADFVLERLGIAYELRLIENIVDLLHDLVSYLNAHADVDCAGLMRDIMLSAELFEPVRAAASGRDDRVIRENLYVLVALADIDTLALVALKNYVVAFVAEEHVNAVFDEILLDGIVYVLRLLGAEVAYRAVNEAKTRFYRALSYLLDFLFASDALNMSVRAELEIDAVGIFNSLLRHIVADELGELTADLGAQGQLAVRERARAGESRGDVAVGLAVHADLRLSLRTGSFLNGNALLHDEHFLLRAFAEHFQCGKNTGGACAYDYNVIICHF